MFRHLRNEAIIQFELETAAPLLIASGDAASIDPLASNLTFVRGKLHGIEVPYMPGSSLKGVFRSRYEQLGEFLGKSACDAMNACDRKLPVMDGHTEKGTILYHNSCMACRLFGNRYLGARIAFADAYPKEGTKVSMGEHRSVAIDRITGAIKPGALFEYEVVESGCFTVTCKVQNFALYQLRLFLWILQDVQEGYVTFGRWSSRGNGIMHVKNVTLHYRVFGSAAPIYAQGYEKADIGKKKLMWEQDLIAYTHRAQGLDHIIDELGIHTREELQISMKRERFGVRLK
ncbi:MAG: RAMP superfamily CRISPR-associated protein [Clostridium sp.]|jgi:CRISPR-associated RAMP protein (TIGR02581 family)|nr:RAMP superfamily CRISPR-associated protein [Clostridium sp.]